jgi:hypothetical protein
MINFGGSKRYAVKGFEPRIRALHRSYSKPVFITEVNTHYGGRLTWLENFRSMLHRMPWIKGVVWSQLPSRGAAQMKHPGVLHWDADLHWDVQADPASAAVLRGIIEDGLRAS